jgi:hypothetical protein
MSIRYIYLDTNLWNRLLDQHASPKSLLERLRLRGSSLALSNQTVHELAKTFASDPSRGRALFQYVKQYLDVGIGVAKDVMEQLHVEVDALNTRKSTVDGFLAGTDLDSLERLIDTLATGHFDDAARSSVESGVRFARSARAGQNAHFDGRQDVKNRLQQIGSAHLEVWMQAELSSDRGAAILARHLLRMYVEGLDEPSAGRLAHSLLRIPIGIAARGLVRAELYSNWRCAQRHSLRSDVIDDMYHVLNASYCGTYATAEVKQAEYTSHLLPAQTQVAIYTDRGPIDAWLLTCQ